MGRRERPIERSIERSMQVMFWLVVPASAAVIAVHAVRGEGFGGLGWLAACLALISTVAAVLEVRRGRMLWVVYLALGWPWLIVWMAATYGIVPAILLAGTAIVAIVGYGLGRVPRVPRRSDFKLYGSDVALSAVTVMYIYIDAFGGPLPDDRPAQWVGTHVGALVRFALLLYIVALANAYRQRRHAE